MSSQPRVLITGAVGGLAAAVVETLAERYSLVGVDPRPLKPGMEFPGEFHQIDYRQRKMADVFRRYRFDALFHLGRVPTTSPVGDSHRYNLNVLGTQNLLDLALRYAVKNVIVFSTFHVYGAHEQNHLHITEEAPLRATQTFSELSDAVELDHISTMFLLKHRDVRTVILRPVNVIGPRIMNQITRLLRSEFVPILMGYDPLQQFIHEQDVAKALSLCLESDKSGVYNLAGEGVIPYSRAIQLAGGKKVPIPSFLAYTAFGVGAHAGSRFPRHLIDYFRYPTVVSDAAFRRDFEFYPDVRTVDALRNLREIR
jgi:UDP-glucose 4-epimerase